MLVVLGLYNDTKPLEADDWPAEDRLWQSSRILGFSHKKYDESEAVGNLEDVPVRWAKVWSFANLWWERWEGDSFQLMCPRKKWSQVERSLSVGDIVMVKSDSKLKKTKYRLAKVTKLLPDEEGNVRTVEIGVRRRGKAGGLDLALMAVQRLVVVLPGDEVWEAGVPVEE